VYYGGGWFVALRTTLVHATDDDELWRTSEMLQALITG